MKSFGFNLFAMFGTFGLSRAFQKKVGPGYEVIPYTLRLGTGYPVDSITDNGDGSWQMVSADNGGGGVTSLLIVFENGSDYVLRYKLTGTSTVAQRIRGALSPDGNSATGNLNNSNATIDGTWREIEFTAGANDRYLQIGMSSSGNCNIKIEVEIRKLP